MQEGIRLRERVKQAVSNGGEMSRNILDALINRRVRAELSDSELINSVRETAAAECKSWVAGDAVLVFIAAVAFFTVPFIVAQLKLELLSVGLGILFAVVLLAVSIRFVGDIISRKRILNAIDRCDITTAMLEVVGRYWYSDKKTSTDHSEYYLRTEHLFFRVSPDCYERFSTGDELKAAFVRVGSGVYVYLID